MAARKPFDADEIIEALDTEAGEDIQSTAIAVLSAVIVATPVGDPKIWQYPPKKSGYVGGHARRNWAVSTARPIDQIRGKPGKGPGASGATSQALNQGKKRIESYSVQSKRIYIQNNVPYAVRLNEGHSTQAPANFVETAVMAGRNVGRNDRKELP
jgi:hypothetical protein